MNRLFYPAVFHNAEEGGFWITFPDFPECVTQGETIQHAYNMAWDALGLCIIDRMDSLPVPSNISDIPLEDTDVLMLIEFNLLEYKRKHNSRPVKKTLSIPEWLNEEALKRGVNFSAILQKALREELGV